MKESSKIVEQHIAQPNKEAASSSSTSLVVFACPQLACSDTSNMYPSYYRYDPAYYAADSAVQTLVNANHYTLAHQQVVSNQTRSQQRYLEGQIKFEYIMQMHLGAQSMMQEAFALLQHLPITQQNLSQQAAVANQKQVADFARLFPSVPTINHAANYLASVNQNQQPSSDRPVTSPAFFSNRSSEVMAEVDIDHTAPHAVTSDDAQSEQCYATYCMDEYENDQRRNSI